jgi:hypothetical protein
VNTLLNFLTEKSNRIHAEDAISLAATVVAERCIDLDGKFPLRDHDLIPGSRVFSTDMNVILFSDKAVEDLAEYAADSVLGILRDSLIPPYQKADFPPVKGVLEYYAANIGKPEDWGKVPLSIPKENFPFIPPLQMGYAIRTKVDSLLISIEDKKEKVKIATLALADILKKIHGVLKPSIALSLALETINGMSKTAPMTKKTMKKIAEKQKP